MKEEVVGETDLELKAHAGHLVYEERRKDEVVVCHWSSDYLHFTEVHSAGIPTAFALDD